MFLCSSVGTEMNTASTAPAIASNIKVFVQKKHFPKNLDLDLVLV